jgi:hypothetical protein
VGRAGLLQHLGGQRRGCQWGYEDVEKAGGSRAVSGACWAAAAS